MAVKSIVSVVFTVLLGGCAQWGIGSFGGFAGLSQCSSDTSKPLELEHGEPVVVLVHGCHGSAGRFKALADVLAFHGQQSVCFSYNDRRDMYEVSQALHASLEQLAAHYQPPSITLIGHSQGGLIARKSLVNEMNDVGAPVELVTVSAPLAGIASARWCGEPAVRLLSLGINDLMCRVVSGEKWYQITSASDFIQEPGNLLPEVERHLMIATDERGSCRLFNSKGQCAQDDYVFSLAEQHMPSVKGLQPESVELVAGHVEIVGQGEQIPHKLIQALQENRVINWTEKQREQELLTLLEKWYLE